MEEMIVRFASGGKSTGAPRVSLGVRSKTSNAAWNSNRSTWRSLHLQQDEKGWKVLLQGSRLLLPSTTIIGTSMQRLSLVYSCAVACVFGVRRAERPGNKRKKKSGRSRRNRLAPHTRCGQIDVSHPSNLQLWWKGTAQSLQNLFITLHTNLLSARGSCCAHCPCEHPPRADQTPRYQDTPGKQGLAHAAHGPHSMEWIHSSR